MGEQNFSRFMKIFVEIQIRAAQLKDNYDRIRLVGWMKKLRECQSESMDPNVRETYARCLLHYIETEGTLKAAPFNKAPPPGELVPYPEVLAEKLRKRGQLFTETGPLQPILEHTSPDGRATVAAKRTNDGSLLCYLSVSRN